CPRKPDHCGGAASPRNRRSVRSSADSNRPKGAGAPGPPSIGSLPLTSQTPDGFLHDRTVLVEEGLRTAESADHYRIAALHSDAYQPVIPVVAGEDDGFLVVDVNHLMPVGRGDSLDD